MIDTNKGIIPDPRTLEEKCKDIKLGADNELKTKKRTTVWTPFLTRGEAQSTSKFDTMSCVSFAVGECLEPQINFDFETLNEDTKKFLKDEGYLQDGKVVFSKRALAIMSETQPTGNYFWKVFDTARNQGLIPDSDLPFGGNSQAEYLGAKISKEMLAKASKFLEYFDIQYQIVKDFDDTKGFNEKEVKNINDIVDSAPVVIGIPIPCGHAIITYELSEKEYKAQDHYIPYFRTNDAKKVPINLAYQGYIEELPKLKFQFKVNLSKSPLYSTDVENLQKILVRERLIKESDINGAWGFFGQKTFKAVIKLQEKYYNEILKPAGLKNGTGFVGESTRKFLNNKYK